MDNQKIAEIFTSMADILAILGENHHRIRAYRRAAENVAALGQPIKPIWQAGELEEIPGIGKTLAAKIDELMRTGRLAAYEKLKAQAPEGVVAMLQITGVGPKRAALFWQEMGLTDVGELEKAAREGRLRALPGMGAKSEQNILDGIALLKRRTGRTLLGAAWPLAHTVLDALRRIPGVTQVATAGSLRRMRETIGDLDLLVASADPQPVMVRFRELPQVTEVLLSGSTKTSCNFRLPHTQEEFQVDLRVLEPARWGTALQYFTGSQSHNIRLRELALNRGLSLSEYSLKREEDGSEILCAAEKEVYAALGLPFIPPELREDRGEIEAALEGRLPDLIEVGDLKGDFQFHTTWSDGRQSMLEMARAAQASGLEYALVTDHSHSLGVVQGLTADDLRRQRTEIEEINRKLGGEFRLLAGVEAEVLADGSLDYPDDVLSELDLVVAAVHSGLRGSRERVTARILAAIRNPHVDIIAHPTGRLIGKREGADLDMEPIFRAAAETDTALEVNAHPKRLDLNAVYARRAIELGVKLAISSDSHEASGFELLSYGVATARRGWATAADAINTLPVAEVLKWAVR